jgi:hypothetical protein
MAAIMANDDHIQGDRALAQELIGDIAEKLNDTRTSLRLDGTILAGLTIGIALDAVFVPSAQGHGAIGICSDFVLACLIICWLRSVTLLVLAARPVLGIVNDHRWRAGAPLHPRARWLHLPPIDATDEEWIWVRAHLLVGAVRIRMERIQSSLTWTLITTGLFLVWQVMAFLVR